MSDSSFVAAMADLRQLAREPGFDSTARARARQGVLQSRGLTIEQLDDAARQLASDPKRAAELWRAIEEKAEAIAQPASATPTPAPGPRPRRDGVGPR